MAQEETNSTTPAIETIEEPPPTSTPATVEVETDTRPWIHVTLERGAEQICRWIFFWETNEKRLGTLIRFLHHSLTYSMVLLYIFIHTMYPSYFLLCVFVFVMSLIWIQHFLTGGCVVSKIEQRLLGDSNSFVDPILKILNMDISKNNSQGIVVYTSTLALGMSAMELLARTILNVKSVFFR